MCIRDSTYIYAHLLACGHTHRHRLPSTHTLNHAHAFMCFIFIYESVCLLCVVCMCVYVCAYACMCVCMCFSLSLSLCLCVLVFKYRKCLSEHKLQSNKSGGSTPSLLAVFTFVLKPQQGSLGSLGVIFRAYFVNI